MLSLKDGAEETLGPDGVTRIAGYASTIAVPWKVYIGVPRETAYASSREELKKSLFVCALTLALALGMAWWASGRIVAPLRRLTRDAEELGKGQLNVRTPISTGDEVGKLAQTFNEMASVLENRTRALEESVRARDEFLAVASHELRTPLTPLTIQIQTLLQIVQSGSMSRFPEEKLRRLLGTTDLQLSRLKRLIDDLLDASRISAGPLILRREPTDLGKLTLESVELFRSDAETAKCPVVLQLDEGVQGNWDSSRLAQVVVNLFSNAIKYGAGHPIRLEVGRTERAAFLSIQDQGIGIHEEDRTRIFERYGRAVTSQHFGGVGLGLYITSQIVQAHRGDVRIRSVPGQGSTFIVELPFEQS